MKSIFAIMLTMFQCTALAQLTGDPIEPWGSRIEVAHRTDVSFYLNTPHKAEDFNLTIKEHAGFECPVASISIKKVSADRLIINVPWSPGSDSSGCEIHLFYKKEYLGDSHLYMSL